MTTLLQLIIFREGRDLSNCAQSTQGTMFSDIWTTGKLVYC